MCKLVIPRALLTKMYHQTDPLSFVILSEAKNPVGQELV